MQQCSFLNNSSRFSKLIYGSMVLVAFLIHSKWLILITSILLFLNATPVIFNISCRVHIFVQKNILGEKARPMQEESGEIRFSYAMAGVLLFVGFSLLQFTKYTSFAWIYLLVVAFMLFIACFVGFCMGTLLYVIFKKYLLKIKTTHNKCA